MKTIILSLTALFTVNSYAVDMSKTENWKDVYKTQADGSLEYIGACTTHQDYKNKKFTITKTLVKYFEPYGMDEEVFAEKFKNLEPELMEAVSLAINNEPLINSDDITVSVLKNTVIPNLDLYQFDIGVGGGNGMILVFNRTLESGVPTYELVSNIFDGDIEFCDSKVWLK